MTSTDVTDVLSVEDKVEALTGSESSSEIWRALFGNTPEAIAAAALKRALGGGGGGGPTILGPFAVDFNDFNAAAGQAIDLGDELTPGTFVEPFAFFSTYFDGGGGPWTIQVVVRDIGGGFSGSDAISFDGNAPSDEGAKWGVVGEYDTSGRFPRRNIYRITEAGTTLAIASTVSSGLTRGEIVVYAFEHESPA